MRCSDAVRAAGRASARPAQTLDVARVREHAGACVGESFCG